MTLVEPYLCEGEPVICSIYKQSLLSGQEIAATDRRVLIAGPRSFQDVRYASIATIGVHSVYRLRWAALALVLALVSIIVLALTTIIPTSAALSSLSVDLTGIIGYISLVGSAIGLLALLALAAFLLTARRGIILRTAAGTFSFSVPGKRRDEAIAFTKAVRDALK